MALSRIVATVTTVRPVASVQVLAANTVNTASISAGVSVQRVVPLAAIKWINIMMDATVDYRGLNPVVHEINIVADTSRLLVGKRVLDSVASADSYTLLVFKKAAVENLHPVDVKTFYLERSISESVRSRDDFNAAVPADDAEVMLFGKHVPDEALTKSDIEYMTFGKRATDPVASSDVRTSDISKPLTEAKTAVDVQVSDISKPIFDSVDAGDEMNAQAITDDGEIMIFGKRAIDSISQVDEPLIEAGKNLTDAVGSFDELLPFELGKGIEDTPVTSETRAVDLVRGAIEDFHEATDLFQFSVNLSVKEYAYQQEGPNQYDTYALSYFLEDYVREGFPALDFSKALSEFKTISETRLNAVGKQLADALVSVDVKGFLLSKPFSEALTNSDTSFSEVGKNKTDAVSTSETRTKFMDKSIADNVNATDDFYGVANTDDDETMVFGKTQSDYQLTSDAEIRSFGKALVDTVTKSDLKTFDLSKSLSDTFTKSDAATKSSGKAASDSFTQSDANTILVGKSNTDSASASESQVRLVGKALTDTAIKSDSASKDNSKALADTFAKSDSVINATGKGLTDTATTGESKTFAISKSLADTVHPTDAYQHIAVSDDDENMLFGKISNDIVLKSDSNTIAAGKALTDPVSKSDSGSLVWTDYWDINYTVTSSGIYVGNSQTF